MTEVSKEAVDASQAHERLLFNLAIFHFFVPAILFATKNLWLIIGLSIAGSLLMIFTIWRQSRSASDKVPLVLAHWQCSWKRSRYLIASYIVSAVAFLIAWGVMQLQPDETMRVIQLSVLGWFCLLPISFTIVGLFIFETSALAQARQGVMPADMKL